jgi:hypothetical protein
MVAKEKVCGFRSEGRICTLLYAAGRWGGWSRGVEGCIYLVGGYGVGFVWVRICHAVLRSGSLVDGAGRCGIGYLAWDYEGMSDVFMKIKKTAKAVF